VSCGRLALVSCPGSWGSGGWSLCGELGLGFAEWRRKTSCRTRSAQSGNPRRADGRAFRRRFSPCGRTLPGLGLRRAGRVARPLRPRHASAVVLLTVRDRTGTCPCEKPMPQPPRIVVLAVRHGPLGHGPRLAGPVYVLGSAALLARRQVANQAVGRSQSEAPRSGWP